MNDKHYPLHPGQTHIPPYYCTIPLEEYERLMRENKRLKARTAELERMDTEHTVQIAKMNGYIHHIEEELATTNAMLEQRNADVARLTSQFGWRSYKDDPPKANGKDDFIFCGHQRYAYQSEAETEYFVDEGYLDMDGTLCMFNDWHEGQEIFEIDYWFPLPMHPDEPKKETKEEK